VYSNPGRYVINTIGGLRFGQKIFEWLLIPENTGTQIFPSIEFTFFDPQVNEFKTQTSPEFVVEVFPGADNRTSLASFDEAGATVFDIPPLKQISSIHTGSSSASTFSGIALWIIPPLVFAVIVVTVISNKVRRRRALEYRKQTALHRAVAQLEKTSGLSGRDASITGTKAIYRYFADKLSLKPDADALTIRNELENAQIQSTQRLNMLLSSVADLEGIQYSPQTIDVNASPIINTLIRQLHYVEQSWA